MSYQLIRGNALSLPMPDESVDLIVTSPPYFSLRSYQDGGEHMEGQIGSEATPADFLDALIASTREMARVLKPTGSMFINLGDKLAGSGGHNNSGISYARNKNGQGKSTLRGKVGASEDFAVKGKIQANRRNAPNHYNRDSGGVRAKSLIGLPWRYALRCIDELNLILRAEIVWAKPNCLPESVKDRVHRRHEQWFHLTKEGRYFSTLDSLREPATYAREARYQRRTLHGQRPRMMTDMSNPLGRMPGSVWTIPTEPLKVPEHLGMQHFAAFPSEWPRRLTLGWCPPDGVVLDPFSGTGTTVAAAHALGRHGVGVDLSADYLRLAEWRITESGLVEKIQARTHALPRKRRVPKAPPTDEQVSLFDLMGLAAG